MINKMVFALNCYWLYNFDMKKIESKISFTVFIDFKTTKLLTSSVMIRVGVKCQQINLREGGSSKLPKGLNNDDITSPY